MMLRMTGAVLVAAGAAWLGFQAAAGLRSRTRAIRDMAGGLAVLERELELNAPPLSRGVGPGAAPTPRVAGARFNASPQRRDTLPHESVAERGRRLPGRLSQLGREGQAVVAPLGDTLGRYDGERQREALAAARRRLEELAAQTEEDSRRMGRVYQALGLSGGAFLVILLL